MMNLMIFELGTGLYDGKYSELRVAQEMQDFWDRARPTHPHVIVNIPEGQDFPLVSHFKMKVNTTACQNVDESYSKGKARLS